MAVIPYFCQYESRELIGEMLEGRMAASNDPLWKGSGATTSDEYAQWASHICGMACLKMILAAEIGKNIPTLDLTRACLPYGAYTQDGDDIKGLIYKPFVAFLDERFGLKAEIATNLSAQNLPTVMVEHTYFIASVHPWIRWPEKTPPQKGGHLVLVVSADDEGIVFHNPSGFDERQQANVRLTPANFDRFFAGRGIAICPRKEKAI